MLIPKDEFLLKEHLHHQASYASLKRYSSIDELSRVLRVGANVFAISASFLSNKNREFRELETRIVNIRFPSVLEFLYCPSVLTRSSSMSACSSSSSDREKAAASKGSRRPSDFEIVRLEIRKLANRRTRFTISLICRYADIAIVPARCVSFVSGRNGRYYDKDNK
jgi:hypothetical protein